MKNVLILSSSPHRNGNSDMTCNEFMRKAMKRTIILTAIFLFLANAAKSYAQKDADNFYKNPAIPTESVSFQNLYKMKVGAALFLPQDMKADVKYPAIIVGHPMGAVKEQSANLYATKMAERGFVTLSIDLIYWGESGGEARNAVSPDMYAETFSAAVDFLGTRTFVDRERIGAIGICGSGSFAVSAAKIDPRLKAVATVSMYDMGSAARHGLKKTLMPEQRKQILSEAAEQRYVEFQGGEVKYTGGTMHEHPDASNPIQQEFYDFYRTERGEYTPKGASPETTTHPTLTSNVKFMNFYPLMTSKRFLPAHCFSSLAIRHTLVSSAKMHMPVLPNPKNYTSYPVQDTWTYMTAPA